MQPTRKGMQAAALILAVLFAASFLSAFWVLMYHGAHTAHCHDSHCPVCALVQAARTLTHLLFSAGAAVCLALLAAAIRRRIAASASLHTLTPVTAFVRMNN